MAVAAAGDAASSRGGSSSPSWGVLPREGADPWGSSWSRGGGDLRDSSPADTAGRKGTPF